MMSFVTDPAPETGVLVHCISGAGLEREKGEVCYASERLGKGVGRRDRKLGRVRGHEEEQTHSYTSLLLVRV